MRTRKWSFLKTILDVNFYTNNRSPPDTVWIISIALPFIFDIDLSYPYIKSFRSYPAFISLNEISVFEAHWLKLNFRFPLPVSETFLCIFDLGNRPHILLNKIINYRNWARKDRITGDANMTVNYLYLYVRVLYTADLCLCDVQILHRLLNYIFECPYLLQLSAAVS